MPNVTLIAPDGTPYDCEAAIGTSLMQAAVALGIPGIIGECGGSCACATCHVFVDPAWADRTGTPAPDEDALLDVRADRGPTSRLACQIRLNPALGGLVVRLPDSQY